jgi:hypothetical protein
MKHDYDDIAVFEMRCTVYLFTCLFRFSCNSRQSLKFDYKILYNKNFKTFITSSVSLSLRLLHTKCFGLHWPSSGVSIS